MKPGPLLLLVGSVALWTGLLAAPPQRTSGQPPLSSSGALGEAPQDKTSQEEEARRACVGAQKSPSSQGKESGGDGEMGAEELQPGKEGSLPPEAAAPPGKLLCRENPQPKRPPVNKLEVGSSGGPRPTETPQGASGKDPSLDPQAQLGGAPGSREKRWPGGKGKPSPLARLKPALPNLETWNPVWDPSSLVTSGGKSNASQKPTSSAPGDKPTPGMGKPTPTEKPVPGSGHAVQDKPKPAPAAGHPTGPTTGEKPAPNRGPEAHVAGEKPSSQAEHEKRPSADKPEHGEEPHAEKESKPETEAEEGKKMEEEAVEKEEGLFDDDGEEAEGEKGKEGKEGAPEGDQDADDAFDKELDYGLNTPPFDAYSYHDAWSDDGAKEADLDLMGEMAALPQAGEANKDGEPTFDVWGDLVGGSRP